MKCAIINYQKLKPEDLERIRDLCSSFEINRKTQTLKIINNTKIGNSFMTIFEVLHNYPGHITTIVDFNAQAQQEEEIPPIIRI